MSAGLMVAWLAGLALIAWLVIAPLLARRRRTALARQGLGREQHRILREQLPCYARLPPPLRTRLDQLTAAFLGEKEFVGCQGLTITPAMKLLISAQACLLVLARDEHAYDALRSVLVYPAAFVVREEWQDDNGVVTEEERVLAGQAWDVSRILLSWEDFRNAHAGPAPYNIVVHEFAHYLDHDAGGTPGAARNTTAADQQRWEQVLQKEFDLLCAAVEHGRETFLDPYAAEDLAEFFAVSSEAFFDAPQRLLQHHPALYRELAGWYQLDPAHWRATDWRARAK